MDFEFCTAPRIVFRRGGFDRIGEVAAQHGRRALVVRGRESVDRSGAQRRLEASFAEHGISYTAWTVQGEPTVARVDRIAAEAREAGGDVVVGLGGGSAVDAAKAVAGLVAHGGSALDYLEVVGRGQPVPGPAVPLIAVPTTAGTGSEVTRNAVLTCEESSFKASMRSPHLIARVALVDPSLTDSLPAAVTASTGLDALTQLIEAYVCTRANPFTDALALAGVERASRSLRRAVQDGQDAEARDDMALASLLSGLCLANAGLGAVHGFAAPLGAAYPIPHGVACAALLPHVMRANVSALREQKRVALGLERYTRVATAWLGAAKPSAAETIDAAIDTISTLTCDLGIPRLSEFGLAPDAVPELVARAQRASSMRANPVPLSSEALEQCLRAAL